MLLGCIGDDFTGASDLANVLARNGMRPTQYVGVPRVPAAAEVEAGVVALKTRTVPPAEAVAEAEAALDWLLAEGCRQIVFKYCSTFDSTPEGNIGPVAEALAGRLGADRVIVCPAFPATGRTVYQGHLFVKDRLLNESGMERHPLNPMADPDLRRWLARQTRLGVGHVAFEAVREGADAIREALAREAANGRPLIVVDATSDVDLEAIGRAAADLPLVTGGSGVALGLPGNFRREGLLAGGRAEWSGTPGPGAILCGSCSAATRNQVARHARAHPTLAIDADAVAAGRLTAGPVAAWMLERIGEAPLASSAADPATVAALQARHGRQPLAAALEALFAEVARRLVAGGATRLVVAGGETAGAIVEALGIQALAIGPEIDPGVPAMKADGRPLALALKSGNFGSEAFFDRALAMLERPGVATA